MEQSRAALRAHLVARFGVAPEVPADLPGVESLARMADHRTVRSYAARAVPAEVMRVLAAVALSAPSKSDLQQADIVLVEDAGQRAASSHTASLSGWQEAYRAVFRRYGIIEADDSDEAVAIAGVLATCPLPTGRRVGVVTVSGGGGAWMADALAAEGLQVPVLSAGLQQALRAYMPPYGAPQNPVDTTAQGPQTGPMMHSAAETLEASDEVDMMVIVTSLASELRVSLDPARLKALIARGRKPVAVWSYTNPSQFGRGKMAEAGMFAQVNLHWAARALRRLAEYAEQRRHIQPPPVIGPALPCPAGLSGVLGEHQAKALLAPYGLPALQEALAQSAPEAATIADGMGYPVALKIQSPDIAHKTEAGGVQLALADAPAVRVAYESILLAVRRYAPDARIDGVLVQKMAPRGHELVVGMVNDPVFGPIMMVGMGGTMVELLGDVAHRPAPLSPDDALAMLRGLRLAPVFDGYRGAPRLDLRPVAELIARLSQAAIDHRGHMLDMELNPIILHADGSGMTVADALITLRTDKGSDHV